MLKNPAPIEKAGGRLLCFLGVLCGHGGSSALGRTNGPLYMRWCETWKPFHNGALPGLQEDGSYCKNVVWNWQAYIMQPSPRFHTTEQKASLCISLSATHFLVDSTTLHLVKAAFQLY